MKIIIDFENKSIKGFCKAKEIQESKIKEILEMEK